MVVFLRVFDLHWGAQDFVTLVANHGSLDAHLDRQHVAAKGYLTTGQSSNTVLLSAKSDETCGWCPLSSSM